LLRIAFPVAGSEVELSRLMDGEPAPVTMKLQGGTPPFRLLANGRPAGIVSRTRQIRWMPDGLGFTRLTILDAEGRAESVDVQLTRSH
jgi:penicillin-binding protein 1C